MALVRWVGRAIGLDVHLDFSVVAICEDGKVRSAGRVPSTPEGLRLLAESVLAMDRVALEVTASCGRSREPRAVRGPGDRGEAGGHRDRERSGEDRQAPEQGSRLRHSSSSPGRRSRRRQARRRRWSWGRKRPADRRSPAAAAPPRWPPSRRRSAAGEHRRRQCKKRRQHGCNSARRERHSPSPLVDAARRGPVRD